MLVLRLLLVALLASSLPLFCQSPGNVYPLIVRGKVMMHDGSPPPRPVSIQRECTDSIGSAPGPLTDKKGEYLWRMDVDPMRTRVCRLEARLPGYVSTAVDISSLNGFNSTAVDLAPIVLSTKIPDPLSINNSDSDVPSRASSAWKNAMKSIDRGNLPEAEHQLQAVTEAAGKFARGWHTLGIIQETLGKQTDARADYEHAIEADPKALPSYVTLARIYIRVKDWPNAAKTADSLLKIDVKRVYPEIYLLQAVARYYLKDLDGAEASAKEAVASVARPKGARAEFVLGRIAEARGDYPAARQHVAKYLEMDPKTPDAELIRAYLQLLGKPEGKGVDPDLELP